MYKYIYIYACLGIIDNAHASDGGGAGGDTGHGNGGY